jgi:hypothetical protein
LIGTVCASALLLGVAAIPSIAAALGPTGNGPTIVESGTYTPTYSATGSTNVASTTFNIAHWERNGDQVTVNGVVSITATAAPNTATNVEFALPSDAPYAPTTAVVTDMTGLVIGNTSTTPSATDGYVSTDTTTKKPQMSFYSTDTASHQFRYSFMYTVR